jgi:molybdopterin-guanine dinucleotide biosynthesis protein
MRLRAVIHVAGSQGAGKTTLIERLLEAEVALAICLRTERDSTLRKRQESAFRGNKLPVTAVIADLSNSKDAGLKKAVARVKLATKRNSP